MIKIGILEGSLRRNSLSRAFARNAASLAPEGVSVEHLPGTGGLPHFDQDVLDAGMPEPVEAFIQAVSGIDALLIVTPEYNWSIPGTLKNAIDWLSRPKPVPLADMPVAIWSVSPGLLGGARVHQNLRHVLHCLDMQIMAKPEVQIAGAKGKIDVESSTITNDETAVFLRQHLEAFTGFIRRCQT